MADSKQQRKELSRHYAQTHRPMGVYQIRNLQNGKLLVGSSLDLDGIFNRHRFMLEMDGNANKQLQQDWNIFGEENFSFEVLERLKPAEEYVQSREELEKYKAELETMEQLWLEELQPYGDRGYNKPPRKV